MDNLFNFVQALTLAHDANVVLPTPVCGKAVALEKAKAQGKYVREKIRELKIKSGEIICLDYKPTNETINPDNESDLVEPINPDDVVDADCVDPEQVSKCHKLPYFKGFKCPDCDCKEWN